MDVPVILAVRKQSQRCPNKILRSFYNEQNLLQIVAEKFQNDPLVYIAAHEPEFEVISKQFNVNFIQRTLHSALSEKTLEIHNYLLNLPYDHVCLVNVCCPLLKSETVKKAIDLFKSNPKILSMFSVTESHDIIFNSDQKLVNLDKVFNSKIRRSNFIGNNAFIIFNIKRLFRTGSYWDYKIDDPYLFKTSRIEAVDIDTVEDFAIAQILYERYHDKPE